MFTRSIPPAPIHRKPAAAAPATPAATPVPARQGEAERPAEAAAPAAAAPDVAKSAPADAAAPPDDAVGQPRTDSLLMYLLSHPRVPGDGRVPPLPEDAAAERVAPPAASDGDRISTVSTVVNGDSKKPGGDSASSDAAGRDARGRFAAGNTGRPKGALNKATVARALLDAEAEHLVRDLIAMGASGDSLALRIAVMRLLPARRELPVEIAVPKVECADDAIDATNAVLRTLSEGGLTPGEAFKIASIIDMQARTCHRETERRYKVEREAAAHAPPPQPVIRITVRDEDGKVTDWSQPKPDAA